MAKSRFKVTLYGYIPSKSNSYIPVAKGKLVKSNLVKKAEKNLIKQMMQLDSIKGEFSISVAVYLKNYSQDIDNVAKIILDCLERCGKIENDKLCRSLYLEKFVDKDNVRSELALVPYKK